MPDWTRSMAQTYEYYTVDAASWNDVKKIDTIISSSISFSSTADTVTTASLTTTELLEESYIRIYLATEQDGIKERFPLGVWLAQTPNLSFNGKYKSITVECYSPLLELQEKLTPVGYFLPVGANVMRYACDLIESNARAPLIRSSDTAVLTEPFIADTSETILSFVTALLDAIGYTLKIDDTGKIYIDPVKDSASLQPVYTFSDDNSSILQADVTIGRDLYGIPNVVECIKSSDTLYSTATITNDDPTSPTSTIARGREIMERILNPDTAMTMEDYARQYLRDASSLEYTVSFSHGYVPNVKIGDCVRLDYAGAGLDGVKAKITDQSIDCKTGCIVSETATYTVDLWEG